jgi:hypothetical protein
MPRDFLRLVRRPGDLIKALRQIAFGGVVAATGLSTTVAGSATPLDSLAPSSPGLTPTIVDRSKKTAKLLLQLPGTVTNLVAQHRSHRSHSSHRSHFSSSGGSVPAPVRPVPAPAPRAATPAPTAVFVTGQIESIDRVNRVFVIRQTATVKRTFAYRDDTKMETALGGSLRFDEFADSNSGRLPLAVGDKVRVTWRVLTGGKTEIATTVQKTP